MILGIDASNIKRGGGLTHLRELLSAADPLKHGIEKVTVWTNRATAAQLPIKPWLHAPSVPALNRGLLHQLYWQRFILPRLAKDSCDILFVPGGNNPGGFHPFVTMSQNILPFDKTESARYGLSWMRVRLFLLSKGQSRTFQSADGMIFLTHTAKTMVEQVTGSLHSARVIPHGISPIFRTPPRLQEPMDEFGHSRPFRWLYVSIINLYKHQWHLAEAVHRLLLENLPVELELIGPSYAPAMTRLKKQLRRMALLDERVNYLGAVPHAALVEHYRRADGFVFASSCENLPIILLEAMAAGLPIACSKRGPMLEVLQDAGVYFDPESPEDIAKVMKGLMLDREKRAESAAKAFEYSKKYTWERCSRQTFSFLAEVSGKHNKTAKGAFNRKSGRIKP
jgi:glycosyltransferase involved in cell wall biosynthesis